MAGKNQKLILTQIDLRVKMLNPLVKVPRPGEGWIHGIRSALNMTLEQLAKKIGITPQSLSDFEKREKEGTITLRSLQQVADALGMHLVYGIAPGEDCLEDVIEHKAMEKAQEIVNRTAQTMALEDQSNTADRLMRAFEEKKKELINEMPKFLWD